jgi:hypothetical protein
MAVILTGSSGHCMVYDNKIELACNVSDDITNINTYDGYPIGDGSTLNVFDDVKLVSIYMRITDKWMLISNL